MTVRGRVLNNWGDLKKRILDNDKLIGKIKDNLSDMTFVTDSPFRVMEHLKRVLPSITKRCQELRNDYIGNEFANVSCNVDFIYLDYINLVATYQKIVEYYGHNQSGPTVVEVD